MRSEEHDLQVACVRYFKYQYPQHSQLLFAVPNGGARNVITASRMKAEGVLSGVSDLILLVPTKYFHALCIEMKTESKSSRQSENQKAWQKNVEKNGYKYIICRNIDDFIKNIELYLTEQIN